MLEKWDKRIVFEIVLIYLENKVDTCSPTTISRSCSSKQWMWWSTPPPSFPYPFISDFLGYPIAPTDASLCHCPIKISISFYCHYKCHDMLLSLQMSVLFNRLFSRPSYSYNFPYRCLDHQWTLTVEYHDLGTNGGHGAGGVGVGGAPTDVAALVTHFRPADNKVTKQRERVLLMDPFGYQNPALPVLIPIGHEVPFKEPIDSVRGTTWPGGVTGQGQWIVQVDDLVVLDIHYINGCKINQQN